jgi:hypothetical protein
MSTTGSEMTDDTPPFVVEEVVDTHLNPIQCFNLPISDAPPNTTSGIGFPSGSVTNIHDGILILASGSWLEGL